MKSSFENCFQYILRLSLSQVSLSDVKQQKQKKSARGLITHVCLITVLSYLFTCDWQESGLWFRIITFVLFKTFIVIWPTCFHLHSICKSHKSIFYLEQGVQCLPLRSIFSCFVNRLYFWELRGPVPGVFWGQRCPILVWYMIWAAQYSLGLLCHIFISRCTKCFQLVKRLDYKRANSAPRHFYEEVTLFGTDSGCGMGALMHPH